MAGSYILGMTSSALTTMHKMEDAKTSSFNLPTAEQKCGIPKHYHCAVMCNEVGEDGVPLPTDERSRHSSHADAYGYAVAYSIHRISKYCQFGPGFIHDSGDTTTRGLRKAIIELFKPPGPNVKMTELFLCVRQFSVEELAAFLKEMRDTTTWYFSVVCNA